MGLNRNLLMGGKVATVNATMKVARLGGSGSFGMGYGFASSKEFDGDISIGGAIYPNPLPNGITVTHCYYYGMKGSGLRIAPNNITAVTINNVKMRHGDNSQSVYSYLASNTNKTIPIIFHFD